MFVNEIIERQQITSDQQIISHQPQKEMIAPSVGNYYLVECWNTAHPHRS